MFLLNNLMKLISLCLFLTILGLSTCMIRDIGIESDILKPINSFLLVDATETIENGDPLSQEEMVKKLLEIIHSQVDKDKTLRAETYQELSQIFEQNERIFNKCLKYHIPITLERLQAIDNGLKQNPVDYIPRQELLGYLTEAIKLKDIEEAEKNLNDPTKAPCDKKVLLLLYRMRTKTILVLQPETLKIL
jgi:hypothetical protein